MKAGGQATGCGDVARGETVLMIPRAPAGSKGPLRRWQAARSGAAGQRVDCGRGGGMTTDTTSRYGRTGTRAGLGAR